MLNERPMRQTLTDLGLDGTDAGRSAMPTPATEVRRLDGDELRRVVELLEQAGRTGDGGAAARDRLRRFPRPAR